MKMKAGSMMIYLVYGTFDNNSSFSAFNGNGFGCCCNRRRRNNWQYTYDVPIILDCWLWFDGNMVTCGQF